MKQGLRNVLLLLIIMHVLSFFNFLPADVDIVKKVLAIILGALFFMHINLVDLLTGNKHQHLNIFLVITYMILFVKNVIALAIVDLPHVQLFTPILSWLAKNAVVIEQWGLYLYAIGIVITTCILCTFPLKKSFLHHFNIKQTWLKAIILFFALNGLYILVVDIIMEWVMIALHSFIVTIALIIMIHKPKGSVRKIAQGIEQGIMQVVKDVKHKHRWKSAVTGLLVLHVFSDLIIFLVPALFGIGSTWYLAFIEHRNVVELFLQQASPLMFFFYLANIIAMLFLIGMPIIMWFENYRKKRLIYPVWFRAVFLAALLPFITHSLFVITALSVPGLIGVSIIAQPLIAAQQGIIFLATILLGILLWKVKEHLFPFVRGASLLFVLFYLSLFTVSTITFYVQAFHFLKAQPFLLIFIGIFGLWKIVFAIIAYLLFLHQSLFPSKKVHGL